MNPIKFLCAAVAGLLLLAAKAAPPPFPLSSNDIVAFVGGADVSTAQQSGHLESLLACAYPGARFRNFGWEGDTVFAQPRDVGFPTLAEHLGKTGVTVIVLQYGRTEALTGSSAEFRKAYKMLIDQFSVTTPRVVLVAPPPFENPGGLLPNLAQKNSALADYVKIISDLARESNLTFIDLFSELRSSNERLTDDGLQLTARGHARCAVVFARQLVLRGCVSKAGEPNPDGAWKSKAFETLRQTIITKNQYWFDYWRPQNWAFLGGDRTEQPSSRDHRDPKIRWFPKEIEEFRTLLETQEKEVARLASNLHPESSGQKGNR